MRLALLLLWVRGHVAAPFWQDWTQQLPQHYTASGVAWSPGAISQLQWPLLQVCYTGLRYVSHSVSLGVSVQVQSILMR